MALLNREKQAIVQQLPIGEISPSPHQTRRDFHEEELAALAQSIDRSGLLNPISVRALPQGGYCLIAGERRWRACQMLGWQRIPALVWQMPILRKLEYAGGNRASGCIGHRAQAAEAARRHRRAGAEDL